MQKKGFEMCKTILSFTRHVNEMNDVGIDGYIKNLIGEEDFIKFKTALKL